MGKIYGFPVIVLRFFNVFRPRQSQPNPYIRVSAIFTSRTKNKNPVIIYEDVPQIRDFIYVADVIRACAMSMQSKAASLNVINITSGFLHRWIQKVYKNLKPS